MLRERYEMSGDGQMPMDVRILHEKLLIYQGILDKWGLRDYQVMSQTFGKLSYAKLLYTFLHGWAVVTLAAIPSLILNAPVGFAANYFAVTEAKKDLKVSVLLLLLLLLL